MRTIISLAALIAALTLGACSRSTLPSAPTPTHARVLREVDFEDLAFDQEVSNPLRLEGVTFRDPNSLSTGFCISPTCEPDPDNTQGGNNQLFLNSGGGISFAHPASEVVLDVQGIGENPFVLAVTDGEGVRSTVAGQGKLFGVRLIELTAASGIASIELESVGGTGGPLAIARVLFTLRPAHPLLPT